MLNFPYILLTKIPKKKNHIKIFETRKKSTNKNFSGCETGQNLKMTLRFKVIMLDTQ